MHLFQKQNNNDVYLFSYFVNNGEDGLHLAYSYDALNWNILNNGDSYLKPEISKDLYNENKLMRDPCIIQGPDGKFHMVWTVSWNARGIGYSNSVDLINWSEQKYIPVMEHEENAQNSWAPEIFYDEIQEQYLIFWASTIIGEYLNTHRMYYTTTKDFQTFSKTKIFVEPGFNVIDATISKNGNQYFMIIKNETETETETAKTLHVLISDNLYNWAVTVSEAISPSGIWVEGPTILRKDNKWIIYFDKYMLGKYGAIMSEDLVNWKDISKDISFPVGTRHGTIFKVSKELLFNHFTKNKNQYSQWHK